MDARRDRRSRQSPPRAAGVYAIFLAPYGHFPEIDARPGDLLYIGMGAGRGGLAQRCHFFGRTGSHSPRRSLAALLHTRLGLKLRRVDARKFSLDPSSEHDLDLWMENNLHVAYETTDTPKTLEDALIDSLSPPLNLKGCLQTSQHQRVSAMRNDALAIANGWAVQRGKRPAPHAKPSLSKRRPADRVRVRDGLHSMENRASRSVESATVVAKRYGLEPKNLRGALRRTPNHGHQHNTSWDSERGSPRWRLMVEVAMRLSRRDLGELA